MGSFPDQGIITQINNEQVIDTILAKRYFPFWVKLYRILKGLGFGIGACLPFTSKILYPPTSYPPPFYYGFMAIFDGIWTLILIALSALFWYLGFWVERHMPLTYFYRLYLTNARVIIQEPYGARNIEEIDIALPFIKEIRIEEKKYFKGWSTSNLLKVFLYLITFEMIIWLYFLLPIDNGSIFGIVIWIIYLALLPDQGTYWMLMILLIFIFILSLGALITEIKRREFRYTVDRKFIIKTRGNSTIECPFVQEEAADNYFKFFQHIQNIIS